MSDVQVQTSLGSTGHDPIFGDLRLRDEMERNEVKAMRLELRLKGIERFGGVDVRERVVAALPDDVRTVVRNPPFASTWMSNRILMGLDRCLVEVGLNGDVGRLREMARALSQEEISTVYRFLIRFASPGFVARRLANLFSSFYRHGHIDMETVDERSWRFTLVDTVLPLYSCAHNVPGWIEAALLLSGVAAPRVDHEQCRHRGDPRCVWLLRA